MWLLDMDGVIWRGKSAIPGSAAAIGQLRGAGHRVGYVTNNSALSAQGYVDKLAGIGIDAELDDVVHGGHAVASLVQSGERVLVCGGDGILEALDPSVEVVRPEDTDGPEPPSAVDAVIIGWRPDFDYRMLSMATRAVLAGARLLAPSADPLYPTNDGFSMGGGALTAAVVYATGTPASFAAKPFAPIVGVVQERFGAVDLMVGDQSATDGRLAERLGVPFALVHTGVSQSSPAAAPHPVAALDENASGPVPTTYDAADLATLVAERLAAP